MQNSISPETSKKPKVWLLALLGLMGAALLWFIGAPIWNAVSSFFGLDTVQAMWYVTRAAGLAAYLLLWLSTVWGLAVASKIFDPVLHRAFTFDAHEWISLLALGFVGLHMGVLLFDAYSPFSIIQILIPFTSAYRALWVGIGVIGMYLMVLVTVTFYVRSRIGQRTFRSIHLFSFISYAAVTFHSLFAGTDSTLWSSKLIYATTALVIVFLTVYWYAMTRMKKPAARPQPSAPRVSAQPSLALNSQPSAFRLTGQDAPSSFEDKSQFHNKKR